MHVKKCNCIIKQNKNFFSGKETSSGKLVAMKQEKPPNYWEYYICLEIQVRIASDEMVNKNLFILKIIFLNKIIHICFLAACIYEC